MRKLALILFVLFALSCAKHNEPFQLPLNILSEIGVYDIGNAGNASDIRVSFTLSQQSDLVEVRAIIAKAGANFSPASAILLSSDKYFKISISGLKLTGRLADSQKDSDGNNVLPGNNYSVYLLLVGKENSTQLSQPKPVILQDKPIYAGDYQGLWNTAIYTNFPVSMHLNEDYTGGFFYTSNLTPCCKDSPDNGSVNLQFNGSNIEAFQYDERLLTYKGGCFGTFKGTGSVKDDITFSINFTGVDCDGDHGNGTILLTRIPN